MSPLTRGAWIETCKIYSVFALKQRRPSHEGRGLKPEWETTIFWKPLSPLTRGAWIETYN